MQKVKWGVIGTADIAKGCTIPGMVEADNCELYAIAGRNPEKVNQFKDTFGFVKGYTDYNLLLQDEEIEAVYIPLPNQLHYEWVKKAINAGKNVLCEKPLAPTAKQAAELYEAAKEKGVILMEAFAYLHTPYIDALKEEIREKTFGDGVRASFTCGMNLEKEESRRFDRLYIHGSKGYIKSNTEFNQAGELSYTLCVDGKEKVKTVQVLQNYRLEVEQLGRCILNGEQPHVSKEFSCMNARVLDKVLDAIDYHK